MPRKPTPKTRNGGEWTEARYRSFIVSMLRRSSARWGPKNEAKRDARYPTKLLNRKTGRYAFHGKCAGCGEMFPETTLAVDHIDPVIDPHVGFVDWDTYIARMYCEKEGFQVLCQSCHKEKTDKERQIATERKRRERVQP